MKYVFLGGAGEVGASCLFIQIAGCNMLIDCGVRVNRKGSASSPDFDMLKHYAPHLDLIFISHAHADHVGALPMLHKMYPETYMITTHPTAALSRAMLKSTAYSSLAEAISSTEDLRYSIENVNKAFSMMRIADPDPIAKRWQSLWNKDWSFKFIPSGHILGAMSIVLRTPEGIFLYTGDVSAFNQRTVDGIGNKLDGVNPDFMWCESTYGEGNHPARTTEEQNLAKAVESVIKAGGSVLIPSFALGRAQEIMLILSTAMGSKLITRFPIVTDGLVNKICKVYEENSHFASKRFQGWASRYPRGFSTPPLLPLKKELRGSILTNETPKCVIASSGMLTGGASVEYAKVMAGNPKDAIFLSGYQDDESPGGHLQVLQQGDKLHFTDGTTVTVKCQVKRFHLSAHSDQGQLIKMIKQANPKAIALVHGSNPSRLALSEKLVKDYPVTLPENNELYKTT